MKAQLEMAIAIRGGEGKRGANEVATILIKYIEEVDKRNEAQNILLYCDSCPGQNKNITVLTALHYALQKCTNILTVQINYPLPGHTMMPVDSMHAVIENSITATVWAPSQWATLFQLARKKFRKFIKDTLMESDEEDDIENVLE
ncbi:hypothetical protein MSG28_000618 [Choristoneura fumiferana]|uniref:Uncharacterized protein n=1 Tax=Choristoneura fumiferana TaxID=7141 RepID=A0ACC0K1P5_CHOFU|nr:hypothetical protein MSG28_000618 [Choristoneura fumiferana]